MTGWNEHGHAVKTGLPVDRYLGSGDLQDAEDCGYAPVSVLAELGVDTTYGDPLLQFQDGYITLLDGTWLSRGGTLNSVWAVARVPSQQPPARRHGPDPLRLPPPLPFAHQEEGQPMISTNRPHQHCWRLKRPSLYVYRAGDPKRFGVAVNRYANHPPIGVALQLNGRVFSLTWARLG